MESVHTCGWYPAWLPARQAMSLVHESLSLNLNTALGAPFIGFACSSVWVPYYLFHHFLYSTPRSITSILGILCVQVQTYYERFSGDRLIYKIFVRVQTSHLGPCWFLVDRLLHYCNCQTLFTFWTVHTEYYLLCRILEIVDQAFIGHSVYYYTITYVNISRFIAAQV